MVGAQTEPMGRTSQYPSSEFYTVNCIKMLDPRHAHEVKQRAQIMIHGGDTARLCKAWAGRQVVTWTNRLWWGSVCRGVTVPAGPIHALMLLMSPSPRAQYSGTCASPADVTHGPPHHPDCTPRLHNYGPVHPSRRKAPGHSVCAPHTRTHIHTLQMSCKPRLCVLISLHCICCATGGIVCQQINGWAGGGGRQRCAYHDVSP